MTFATPCFSLSGHGRLHCHTGGRLDCSTLDNEELLDFAQLHWSEDRLPRLAEYVFHELSERGMLDAFKKIIHAQRRLTGELDH